VEQLLDKSFKQKSKIRNRKIFRIFLKKIIFKNHKKIFLKNPENQRKKFEETFSNNLRKVTKTF
jgi:hypothetical protein